MVLYFFFFQAEDGIRDLVRSRGLGDVYKRQEQGEKYKAIASAIGKRFKLPMASIDETLTTVEAQRRNGKEHEDNEEAAKIILEAVSYTHLTLPTIYSV